MAFEKGFTKIFGDRGPFLTAPTVKSAGDTTKFEQLLSICFESRYFCRVSPFLQDIAEKAPIKWPILIFAESGKRFVFAGCHSGEGN
jgi:hypothetical protein